MKFAGAVKLLLDELSDMKDVQGVEDVKEAWATAYLNAFEAWNEAAWPDCFKERYRWFKMWCSIYA